jgi:hypothetical protein
MDKLESLLGESTFDVVDRWDGDLFAIGIARPDNHRVLVYISTYDQPLGTYFVSLELPALPFSDDPYASAGEFRARSLDELVSIIRKPFGTVD